MLVALLVLNHNLSTTGLVCRWPRGQRRGLSREPSVVFHSASVCMFSRHGGAIVLHFMVTLPLLVLQRLMYLFLVYVSSRRIISFNSYMLN